MVKISARSIMFGGVRAQNPLKKGSFCLNFTATNSVLIKLTANMYLNKVFHLAKSWGVTHSVIEGVNEKPLKINSQNKRKSVFDLNTSIKTVA